MQTITIRESAVRACRHLYRGGEFLYALIREALGDEPVNLDSSKWSVNREAYCAVYEAVMPDLREGVCDELSEEEFAQGICSSVAELAGALGGRGDDE